MSPANDSIFITLPTAIVSVIITLITSLIAVFVIHKFFSPDKEDQPSSSSVKLTVSPPPSASSPRAPPSDSLSPNDSSHTKSHSVLKIPVVTRPTNPTTKIPTTKRIQLYLSSCITVFNALNTLFNTVYCVWLVVDPQEPNQFYVDHPSHTHRVTSTVCWYISKTLFVWMLCFRLYHAFKGSIFGVNRTFILFLCITNSIVAPVGLCVAYWAVYEKHHPTIAEFAFNTWRILYQIIVFIILYMFCHRLLQLVIDKEMYTVMKAQAKQKSNNEVTIDPGTHNRIQHSARISSEFLEVITRQSLLVLTVSTTVLMTTFCFFGFRFIFLPQTCITLLIPMNMAAVDSLITSICVLCLFPAGKRLYSTLCHPPHVCFKRVCLFFAKRTLTVF